MYHEKKNIEKLGISKANKVRAKTYKIGRTRGEEKL